MTLVLNYRTSPEIEIKAIDEHIIIGESTVSYEDFCEMVKYVMCNTNLIHADPRRQLMQYFNKLHLMPGFDNLGERYEWKEQCDE